MRLGKTIDAYAKLIEQAWQTTWNHKEWWIIAAFAGLANTGGVFSSVFNTFWRLRPADMITAETILDTFPSIGWFFTYTSNLIALENGQRLLSIALFILVLLLTLLIVTTCQHLLLSAVKKGHNKTQQLTVKNVRKDLSHLHVSRLFAVDASLYILLTILLTGSAIPLSLWLTDYVSVNLFLYAGIYAIILPAAFLLNIVGMLALIYISQKDLSLGKAIREALTLVHKHWLSALELSLILFFVNLVASLLFFLALFIVAISVGLLFEIAFAAGTYVLMSLVTFFGLLLAGAVALIYAGAITMFQYSAWSGYAKRIARVRHRALLEHTATLAEKVLRR